MPIGRVVIPKSGRSAQRRLPVLGTALRSARMSAFKLVSHYEPAGDQPTAIAKLTDGLRKGA